MHPSDLDRWYGSPPRLGTDPLEPETVRVVGMPEEKARRPYHHHVPDLSGLFADTVLMVWVVQLVVKVVDKVGEQGAAGELPPGSPRSPIPPHFHAYVEVPPLSALCEPAAALLARPAAKKGHAGGHLTTGYSRSAEYPRVINGLAARRNGTARESASETAASCTRIQHNPLITRTYSPSRISLPLAASAAAHVALS
jgi:hypothetical protein